MVQEKATRGVVTVIGEDRVGIIAGVTQVLAEHHVNILDISQTIMQDLFTMIMVCDLANSTLDFSQLSEALKAKGQELGVQISIQHEDVFKFMHRI